MLKYFLVFMDTLYFHFFFFKSGLRALMQSQPALTKLDLCPNLDTGLNQFIFKCRTAENLINTESRGLQLLL